ncbi:MAG TPA: hypothetical protein DCP63_10055 [Bacteroidetes bacterium]|nr:hypothetical protein [Bacteroidota bacterium]
MSTSGSLDGPKRKADFYNRCELPEVPDFGIPKRVAEGPVEGRIIAKGGVWDISLLKNTGEITD